MNYDNIRWESYKLCSLLEESNLVLGPSIRRESADKKEEDKDVGEKGSVNSTKIGDEDIILCGIKESVI